MPKIRDLGISVIPLTMRPPEIGGGAADVADHDGANTPQYHAAAKKKPPCEHTKKPPCDYTKKPPCEYTKPVCAPTDGKCAPTNDGLCETTLKCVPTNDGLCESTGKCAPTDGLCKATGKTGRKASAAALSDEAIAQLRQQLRQQIGTDLLN